MGLIKDIRDIESTSNNRFNVTEEDCTGAIFGLPLEILCYALKTQEELNGKIDLDAFKINGIVCAFMWHKTKDGSDFWHKINQGDYDEFYKKYPEYKQCDY